MEDKKTTITGCVLAVLISVQTVVSEDFDIKKDWLKFLVAAGIGFFGWYSADSKK